MIIFIGAIILIPLIIQMKHAYELEQYEQLINNLILIV
jgi:hypothetical protein